jgi:hypothetical protein
LSDVLKPNSRRAMEYALQGRTRHNPSCMSISRGSETAYDLLPASGGAPGPPREMYGGRYYWAGPASRARDSGDALPHVPLSRRAHISRAFKATLRSSFVKTGATIPATPAAEREGKTLRVKAGALGARGACPPCDVLNIYLWSLLEIFRPSYPLFASRYNSRVSLTYTQLPPQHFLHARLSACTLLPSRVA